MGKRSFWGWVGVILGSGVLFVPPFLMLPLEVGGLIENIYYHTNGYPPLTSFERIEGVLTKLSYCRPRMDSLTATVKTEHGFVELSVTCGITKYAKRFFPKNEKIVAYRAQSDVPWGRLSGIRNLTVDGTVITNYEKYVNHTQRHYYSLLALDFAMTIFWIGWAFYTYKTVTNVIKE